MIYFAKVNVGMGNSTKLIYVMLPHNEKDKNPPMLTKEILLNDQSFRSITNSYRKEISIIFVVYQTEEEVNAASQPEEFEELIQNGKAIACSSTSDFMIDRKQERKKPKKAKSSPLMMIFAILATALLVGIIAFGATSKYFKEKLRQASEKPPEFEGDTAEDGLLIPKQEDLSADTDQITITIDRSYSSIPVEDLQLKGAVEDGKARITLPAFDKTDFFTHVAGYSWGFTSDPEGKKIEYYGGQTYSFETDTKLYRVLVKYGGGNGTKDDPYLIDYFDQLELMGEEKARGYFRQTADISFPSWREHQPIDTVNMLKSDPESEHFEYDGNGYVIEGLTKPLFGKVSGSVIKNVNIRNSSITGSNYSDYGSIVCKAYNYRYKAKDSDKMYETGETLIQHCSVSHSSITLSLPTVETNDIETQPAVTTMEVVPPDLIEYDADGNPIDPSTTTEPAAKTKTAEYAIGAITGNGGQIENCYVNDFSITNLLPDYILYVGGISGKPANVINTAVYFFSSQGNIFHVGGIAGSAAGTGMYDADGRELPDYYGGNIQGCYAGALSLRSEVSAGGVAGVGGSRARNALISNTYANKVSFSCGEYDMNSQLMIKTGTVGGVFGTDATDGYGHLITNTVAVAEQPIIGQKTKSSYDDTVRMAPDYAFYQENILTVINKNTVRPNAPEEIFTGTFMFGEQGKFGDEGGSLAFPADLKDMFSITTVKEGT